MKKPNQLILIFLLLISGVCWGTAQTFSPAYMVSIEGDTIVGNIRAISWTQAPEITSHFVVTQPDNSEKTWEAKEIMLYVLQNGRSFYAKKWPHNGMRQFLEPREQGQVQLFVVPDPLAITDRKKNAERVVFDPDFRADVDNAYYVSSQDTELIIRLKKENYDIILQQVLKDCPQVTDNIGKKKFRWNNLDRIVATYNTECR